MMDEIGGGRMTFFLCVLVGLSTGLGVIAIASAIPSLGAEAEAANDYFWVVAVYGDQGALQAWRTDSEPQYIFDSTALRFQDAQTGYQTDVSGNFIVTRIPGG